MFVASLLLAQVIFKIPKINVVDDDGKHVAMDNRRLYSFLMAFDDHYLASRLYMLVIN